MNVDLQALHAEVWAFRRDMAPYWPTPDPLDSLRFAFTEAGEAMDAWLRIKGGYARNHAKEPDVLGELADCALMLISSLKTPVGRMDLRQPKTTNLEQICIAVAIALSDCLANPTNRLNWQHTVLLALSLIVCYPGMDLPAELRKRLARIRAKHGPKEE